MLLTDKDTQSMKTYIVRNKDMKILVCFSLLNMRNPGLFHQHNLYRYIYFILAWLPIEVDSFISFVILSVLLSDQDIFKLFRINVLVASFWYTITYHHTGLGEGVQEVGSCINSYISSISYIIYIYQFLVSF